MIVTGGFGVLGHAVMEAALAAGAFVALPGRELADKIAPRERLLVLGGVDLTDFAAVMQAFETVAARFGKIDGLANVAGGFRGFWSEVQRVYENRIWTSLPSSLRIPWNGVLKPKHFLGVRLAVMTMSWISSSDSRSMSM